MAKSPFVAGDRIAYAARFLKNTGQTTGSAGTRRGTYLGPWIGQPGFARVRWDDEAAMLEASREDEDYKADIREHGSVVFESNITRVGSARFALNDL